MKSFNEVDEFYTVIRAPHQEVIAGLLAILAVLSIGAVLVAISLIS